MAWRQQGGISVVISCLSASELSQKESHGYLGSGCGKLILPMHFGDPISAPTPGPTSAIAENTTVLCYRYCYYISYWQFGHFSFACNTTWRMLRLLLPLRVLRQFPLVLLLWKYSWGPCRPHWGSSVFMPSRSFSCSLSVKAFWALQSQAALGTLGYCGAPSTRRTLLFS